MKKLMIMSLVSASVLCSAFGVEFRNMKLGDTIYNQQEADEIMRPFRQNTYVRDDTWYISYTYAENNVLGSVSDTVTKTNGQVIIIVTSTVSYEREATLHANSQGYVYQPYTWTAMTPGCTISNDTVYASAPGMYRISGVDAKGREAVIDIPFTKRTDETTTYSQYISDQNANRNCMITNFIDICTNSPLVQYTMRRADDSNITYTNNELQAITASHAWTVTNDVVAYRSGNVYPWAISPHVMASAWHYSWSHWWSGDITLANKVSGGTFTVHESAPWINAAEWAKTHGWTAEEVSEMGISDIALIVIDRGEIPSECCPYFTDRETIAQLFGSLEGLPCWTHSQSRSDYCEPGIYSSEFGSSFGIGFHYIPVKSTTYRQDILDLMNSKVWNFWSIIGGDSGRSIFFRWKGQNVITASYTSVFGGPSYIKGFPVIKAFCAAQGDTIKEMVP